MAIIRPVTELQRKVGELSRLAKETKEPIYLTKNGAEHRAEEMHQNQK